jgi:hypothetical protein
MVPAINKNDITDISIASLNLMAFILAPDVNLLKWLVLSTQEICREK